MIEQLKSLSWNVLVVWECQTRDTAVLEKTLVDFLGPKLR